MTAMKAYVQRLAGAALLLLTSACAGVDDPRQSREGDFGSLQAAIINAGDDTTVLPGTPSTRNRSCPGGRLPDQCGSWAGVELSATHGHGWPLQDRDHDDEHCLCQPIAFQIPAGLPVTRGNAGRNHAELEFRKESGRKVTCRYEGNRRWGRAGFVGGDEYVLERCSDGSRAGATVRADWFELNVKHGDFFAGPTTVELRLGEPDVVEGVVQEQVFYSDDPRIPEAALHVPRGSAPPFQDFTLDVSSRIRAGSTLANGGQPFTTTGYAVDARARGDDDFDFVPVPGAACPRIELPYDPALVASLAGPNGHRELTSRLIVDVPDALAGRAALESEGDVRVDPVRHTVSVCIAHLSFRVTGLDSYNANLARATIRENVSGSAEQDLLQPTLPTLKPLTGYTLTLEFLNTSINRTWTSGTVPVLVAVGAENTSGQVSPVASPWFGSTSFELATFVNTLNSGGTVGVNNTARFTLSLTSPTQGAPLNLCLREGLENYFGECFSWDPLGTAESDAGTKPAVFSEICDGQDNDGNGAADNAVPGTGGICTAPDVVSQGVCRGGYSCTTPSGPGPNGLSCVQAVGPGAEICNGLDDDCNGATDEVLGAGCGSCGGRTRCDGSCSVSDPPGLGGGCQSCGGVVQCDGSCSINDPSNYGQPCGCGGSGTIRCDGTCSVGACHEVVFRAIDVDDRVAVANGFAAVPPTFPDGVFLQPPIFDCLGDGSVECRLSPPFPEPGWIPFRTGQVSNGDGRYVFTLSLHNGGCFNTHGVFYVIIDGVEHELSRQGDVIAHCGVTHQQTFIIDFVNGTVEPLGAAACVNVGECLAGG